MPPIRPQVLNDAFQAAADQARQKLPKLTHNQEVCFTSWRHHNLFLLRCFPIDNVLVSHERLDPWWGVICLHSSGISHWPHVEEGDMHGERWFG